MFAHTRQVVWVSMNPYKVEKGMLLSKELYGWYLEKN